MDTKLVYRKTFKNQTCIEKTHRIFFKEIIIFLNKCHLIIDFIIYYL